MFAVDDIDDDTIARLRPHGAQVLSQVASTGIIPAVLPARSGRDHRCACRGKRSVEETWDAAFLIRSIKVGRRYRRR